LTKMLTAFPDYVFDLVNTCLTLWLMVTLFALAFGRFPSWSKARDLVALLIIFSLSILIFPLLGQLWFWRAGTCNHTWGNIFLLSFLIPFRINGILEKIIKHKALLIIYILWGFIAGLSVENSSLIAWGALGLLMLYRILRKTFNAWIIFPLLAYTISMIILIFSPGTTTRRGYWLYSDDASLSGFALILNRLTKIGKDLISISAPLIILFAISFLLYLLCRKYILYQSAQSAEREHNTELTILQALLFLVFSFLSVLIMASIPYQSDQKRSFELFWLILLCLTSFNIFKIWEAIKPNHLRFIGIFCLLCGCLLQMAGMLEAYKGYHAEYTQREALILVALANGTQKLSIPTLTTENTRTLETREYMGDLDKRISIYYGFEELTIIR
jgi:hypothetical protein